MNDVLERARLAYERAGRGCIITTRREPEPRYATVTELAGRFDSQPDSMMLLTAVSEAVERYNPETEAVVLVESETGFEVSIVRIPFTVFPLRRVSSSFTFGSRMPRTVTKRAEL